MNSSEIQLAFFPRDFAPRALGGSRAETTGPQTGTTILSQAIPTPENRLTI